MMNDFENALNDSSFEAYSLPSFFNIVVSQTPDKERVQITGVNVKDLLRDLYKVWDTALVTTYMLDSITSRGFTVYNFFVPDLHFCIGKILEYKNRYTTDETIKSILKGLEENTWYKDFLTNHKVGLDYDELGKMQATLLPPQMEALKTYDRVIVPSHLYGYLLAADTGTGKSIISLALSVCLKPDVTIVVCPKSILIDVWVNAIQTQFGKGVRYYSSITREVPKPGMQFYLIHYEALDIAVRMCEHVKFKKPVIILDESHNLNDVKALRTQDYLELCKTSGSKNIIHSSATAIKALAYETIPLFRAIDPMMFNLIVEEKFKMIYRRSASRALEILNNRLAMVSHKIAKAEVMGDAKPIEEVIKVVLPDAKEYTLAQIKVEMKVFIEERRKMYASKKEINDAIWHDCINEYKRLKFGSNQPDKEFNQYMEYIETMRVGYSRFTMGALAEYCNKYEKEQIIPLLQTTYAKSLTQSRPGSYAREFKDVRVIYKYVDLKILGEFLGGVLGRKRAELHSKMIEHSGIDKIVKNGKKKTICFTNYVDTAKSAEQYFRDRGFNPLLVYAETSNELEAILDKFKNDPKYNPLISTMILSTGVTLTVANQCIFLNEPFRSFEREQAANRIFRIGQDEQVYLYSLVLDTPDVENLSSRMKDIQDWSKSQVDQMLGSGHEEINKEIGLESLNITIEKNSPSDRERLTEWIKNKGYTGYNLDSKDSRVFLTGLSGSGKTTSSLELGKLLSKPVFHTDDIYNRSNYSNVLRNLKYEDIDPWVLTIFESKSDCIIEGVALICRDDYSYFKDKCVIVNTAGYFKSTIQSIKRDGLKWWLGNAKNNLHLNQLLNNFTNYMEENAMSKFELALEGVDFSDGKFGKELENELANLRQLNFVGNTALDCSNLNELVKKHTGISAIFSVMSGDNACVFVPDLDKNNPIIEEDLRRYFDNADSEALMRKKNFIDGTVDLKEGRIYGDFTKIGIRIQIGTWLLSKTSQYTVNEVTAVVLHEIGHVMVYFEMLGRATRTNYIMSEGTKRLLNSKTKEQRIIIFNDIEEAFGTKLKDKEKIAEKLKAKDAYNILILSQAVEEAKYQTGYNLYDTRAFEQLADNYATRQGYAKGLALFVDKAHRIYGDNAYLYPWMNTLWNTIKFLCIPLIFDVYIIAFGIIPIINFLLIGNFNPIKMTYDPPRQRVLKMKQQLNEALKNPRLSMLEKKKYLSDIKAIDEVLSEMYDNPGLYEFIYKTLFPWGRKQQSDIEIQQEYEALFNNDLFNVAAKFNVKGHDSDASELKEKFSLTIST